MRGSWLWSPTLFQEAESVRWGLVRPAWVNPLEASPRSLLLSDEQWLAVARQRRRHLLVALVSLMRQGQWMSPVAHNALDMALNDAMAANSTPTLPRVLKYLLYPTQKQWHWWDGTAGPASDIHCGAPWR